MDRNQEMKTAFLNDHHARFRSETHRSYNISLNQFFTFCTKDFDEIKARDIRSWLATLEEKGLKPRTIHTKLSGVKSFYQYCLEENKLKKNPASSVHTPKKDDSLPYYLTKRQVALLQDLTRHNIRDRAIIDTLYATGVRISELLNIKIDEVKWETRQIWIREGKGNKERFVLFTHECAERLRAYLNQRKDDCSFLFSNGRGGALRPVTIERKFQGYSDSLGFKVKPHTMRHTFAAHLAEKEMPQSYIQELLGHVNINSTRMYTRLMEHARKKQYDQYQ
ncbi:tyrosine-type recombinase/integrase [Pontibacillus yanchengensis]|uniref:Tyrosine-type recombinase/integrase n=1 Tax=Pontibacillus yanchengensis TaxID=462910 RepID=A0A6I5A1H6_9BACI|nr:site-specific tyrosine recombinase/integron integrase [Pontibacillus yanchengensis]MYL34273.1 tyrosine-type recombinase/integrase [Pontibacillus yanchengensis]